MKANEDVIDWQRIDAVFVICGKEYIAYRVMLYVGGRGHVLHYSLFDASSGEHAGFITHRDAAHYAANLKSLCL